MTQRKLTYLIILVSFTTYIISLALLWGHDSSGWMAALFYLIISPILIFTGYFYGLIQPLYIIACILLLTKQKFASLLCSFFSGVLIIGSFLFEGESSGINTPAFFSINHDGGIAYWLMFISMLLLFIYNFILLVHSVVKNKDKTNIKKMKIFAGLVILLIILFVFSFLRAERIYNTRINKKAKSFLTIKGHISPQLTGSLSLWYATNNPACKITINHFEGVSSIRTRKLFTYAINPDSKGQFSLRLPIDKVQPGYCKWQVRSILYTFCPKKGKVDCDHDKELSVFTPSSKITSVPLVKFNCQQFKFQSKDCMTCESNYEFKQVSWSPGTILFDIQHSKRRGDYDVKSAPSMD